MRIVAASLALSAMALVALLIGGAGRGAGDIAREEPAVPADSSSPSQSESSSIVLPVAGDAALVFQQVVVTAYTSSSAETDSTPELTASMTRVGPGCLALSRDLLRTFTPDAPFDFGDGVVIPGVGVFIVQDTMHPRWTNRADIWFADASHAAAWGRRQTLIARLPAPVDESSPSLAVGLSVRDFSHIAHH